MLRRESTQCPCCKKKAESKDEINSFFGWREVSGKTIPQLYCYKCRTAKCTKGEPCKVKK